MDNCSLRPEKNTTLPAGREMSPTKRMCKKKQEANARTLKFGAEFSEEAGHQE
jgi:hypothetical protein